jgi:hypothetical protein
LPIGAGIGDDAITVAETPCIQLAGATAGLNRKIYARLVARKISRVQHLGMHTKRVGAEDNGHILEITVVDLAWRGGPVKMKAASCAKPARVGVQGGCGIAGIGAQAAVVDQAP